MKYKDVNIVEAPKEHGFANFSDARKWAKENIVGGYSNKELGDISISKTAIEKFMSESSISK